MKVSVIVPVYNVYDYLDKCLNSLVNQTLKDIEIIIVNDGTEDNSEEIILEYQKNYENIKYYKKTNGGLSDARNFGLKYATGEFISFVDADDYVAYDCYQKMYEKIIRDGSDILVSEFNYVYQNKIVFSHSNLDYTSIPDKRYLLTPPMACIRLYRRNLLDNISFKKGIYYEDLELNPKMVKFTKKFSFLNEGLYYYVIRSGSIMNQKEFNPKLLDIFDVLESNKELVDKYPDEIEYMYIIHLLRTASLRFLEYDNYKETIDRVIKEMEVFPNYKNNIYYKKSNFKIKLVCYLVYNKHYCLLKIIKKLAGK